MAFFLSTSGHLHPYVFKYLEGQFEKARLEKTEIHSPLKTEHSNLAHIARVLMEEKISALPIIDKNHKLTGMISRTDILRAVVYNRLILK